jgi:hypothetical protein
LPSRNNLLRSLARYNARMANRAYASAWAKDYSEETRLERFARLLETVPVSKSRTGFTELIVRALDISETPLRELDLRSQQVTARDIIELVREHLAPDVAFEVSALWDLWTYDLAEHRWNRGPQKLEIICYGKEFEGGIAAEEGDFLISAGFEHFFTGHARLLGTRPSQLAAAAYDPSADPAEVLFVEAMSDPERLREYQEKTRDNIQLLLRWLRDAETTVPLERVRLWSEGEEDFEARLDEILAVR